MSKIELKPCPFCGSDAEQDYQRGYRTLTGASLDSAAAIYCTSCNADMAMCRADTPEYSDEERMVVLEENWNRRFTLPIPVEGKAGWKLVPRQPTADMDSAGYDTVPSDMTIKTGVDHQDVWKVMFDAAPSSPGKDGDWTVDDTETAGKILTLLGIGCDASNEPGADWRRDKIAKLIRARVDATSRGTDGGQEPMLFVSEQQLPTCVGTYLPTRKHREGNFQMPLYAHPPVQPSTGVPVKVKPLDWKPISDGRFADGIRPNNFAAEHYTTKLLRGHCWVLDDGRFTFLRRTFDTLDAVKAAAQSDYEARILSALSTPPADLAVAAYELSTWAACINWRGKENQQEWLSELREKIELVQSLCRPLLAAAKESRDA